MSLKHAVVVLVLGCAPAWSASSFAQEQQSFREQVESAVAKGVQWLKLQQLKDGSHKSGAPLAGTFGVSSGRTYAGTEDAYPNIIGNTAFVLYTLLKCGVPVDDPVIVKGFAYINEHFDDHAQSTYEIAACLFAWEARVLVKPKQKKNESEIDYKKRSVKEAKYRILPDDQKMIEKLIRNLTTWQDRQDGQPGKGWRYANNSAIQASATPGGTVSIFGNTGGNCDVSATQYALLGLKAASRMGFRGAIKDEVFLDAMEFLLAQQETKGPVVQRENHDSDQRRTFVIGPQDHARGFAYMKWITHDPKEFTTTGSMTTAGVCSLIICKSELLRAAPFARNRKLQDQVDTSIRDGIGWLNTHYSMSTNPRCKWEGGAQDGIEVQTAFGKQQMPANSISGDFYYYLYGMERLGVLGDFDKIDTHDWYVDGATILIAQQKAHGAETAYWDSGQTHTPGQLYDTCFALLFLEKASVPIPGGVVVTQPGK